MLLEDADLILRVNGETGCPIQALHPLGHPLDLKDWSRNHAGIEIGCNQRQNKRSKECIGKKAQTDISRFLLRIDGR